MSIDIEEIGALDDAEFLVVWEAVRQERERRDVLASIEANLQILTEQYQSAAGIHQEPGAPWQPVTSYLNAYPLDFEVTHADKRWVSTRHGASGEPGQSPDWIEVRVEDEIQDWVPVLAGQEWPVGAIVKHNGYYWRNDHVAPNGWEPGTQGSQWTRLDVAP